MHSGPAGPASRLHLGELCVPYSLRLQLEGPLGVSCGLKHQPSKACRVPRPLLGKLPEVPGGCPDGCAPGGTAMPVSVRRGWICLPSGLPWSLEGLGFPPGSGMLLISWSLCDSLLTTTLRKRGLRPPFGNATSRGVWAVSQEGVRGTGSAAPRDRSDHTPQGTNGSSPGRLLIFCQHSSPAVWVSIINNHN